VSANEGSAAVQQEGAIAVAIGQGQSLPARAEPIGASAAMRLGALDVPVARVVATDVSREPPIDAPIEVPAPIEPAPPIHQRPVPVPAPPRPPVVDAGVAHDVPVDAPSGSTPTVTERWRSARLFRSQGKFDDAIAECVAIADSHDRTWAP